MDGKGQLGRRIKDLRKKRGLTLERLAEAANLDVKYLGDIERGKGNPTIKTLHKLATPLSVKAYQILDFDHEVLGKGAIQKRLKQVLTKCDEKELRLVLKFALTLKD